MNNLTRTTYKLLPLCCLLSVLLFQGCAVSPTGQPVNYPQPPPKQPDALAVSFSQQAAEQNLQGRTDLSIATLERGLRVAPKNAMLWSQLAEMKLHQQQYQHARSLAAKSNSLAGTDTKIMQKNYWIIEESQRRAVGQ